MSGLFPEQRTDDEFLSQFNGDVFEVASDGVHLAIGILANLHNHAGLSRKDTEAFVQGLEDDSLLSAVLKFLHRYADWSKLDIPAPYKRAIAVMNYGEEEVQAMEQAGEANW